MRRTTRQRDPGQEAGFTILELSVYFALLLILGAPLAAIALTSTDSLLENDTVNKVHDRSRAAMVSVAATVRSGIQGTPAVTNSGRTLQVTSAAGFNGFTVVPGPIIEYRLAASSGETINGVDDDSDGMVDEGSLFRADLTTGEVVEVAGMLDMNASGFEVAGNGVTITIGAFGVYPDRTSTFSTQHRLTTYPRN